MAPSPTVGKYHVPAREARRATRRRVPRGAGHAAAGPEARRYPGESFSEVILRASWPEDTITGEELLRRCRERGAWFTESELSDIEAAKVADRPAEDKWAKR